MTRLCDSCTMVPCGTQRQCVTVDVCHRYQPNTNMEMARLRAEVDRLRDQARTLTERAEKAEYKQDSLHVDLAKAYAENDLFKKRQAWLDSVSRPTHPEDERPWAAAYLDARAEVERLWAALVSADSLTQEAAAKAISVDQWAEAVCGICRAALGGKP